MSSIGLWGWPLGLGLLWLLFLFVLAIWSVRSERVHVESMAEREARAFFQQIVITRSWNAAHGGVYVLATEDSPPNIHLKENERTVVTEDGLTLAKINPAYMTRQLSSVARNERDIRFHITSLDPVRPQNEADPWESAALQSFDKGVKDQFSLVDTSNGQFFRYMAPLYAQKECMRCHAAFGHEGKKILGGVSVTFPAKPFNRARKDAIAQNHLAFTLIFLVGFVGICGSTYLVQKKREEAELANRTKSVFLANMSHDMRTPLNGIMGLTELMQRKGLPRDLDRCAEMVRHSAWTLLEIVTDITDFSRLESGRLELFEKPFNVRDLLEDALAIFQFETSNKGLSLQGSMGDDVPELLKGDAFRLKQVLTNLIGNAVKFTSKGYVKVRINLDETTPIAATETESGKVKLWIEVEDSGIGIPQEEQENIFDSFRQVDNSYAKKHEGSGLGLAICYQLVSMMGGSISVKSAEGEGSTFSFNITLSQANDHDVTEEHQVEPEITPPPCASCRILVVEDNPLNQIFVTEILEGEGHSVTIANNGVEALETLRSRSFNIIFMDVQMPEMDGLEATRRIRAGEAGEKARTVPIVATTAFAVSGDREQCLKAGMNGYVVKPLSTSQILNALAQHSGMELDKEQTPMSKKGLTHTIIDTDAALERLGGRRDLFNKLVETFLDDTPGKMTALDKAMETDDMTEVLRLSHSLKNSAGMVQAVDMAALAKDMEMCVRAERPEDLQKLHDRLRQSTSRTLEELTKLVEA